MSEVVAESVQTQSDGTLWAITVQTVDAGDFGFEVESQVKDPDSISWRSLDVVGPFNRLVEAIEEADRMYRGQRLVLVYRITPWGPGFPIGAGVPLFFLKGEHYA